MKKYALVSRMSYKAGECALALHACKCRDLAREGKRANGVSTVYGATPEGAAVAVLMDAFGWDRDEAERNVHEVEIYPCADKVKEESNA